MSLQIGIVGLPNAGKSTLFNALTQAGAAVASYPFTTVDPNVGIAFVPDPRLQQLVDLVHPEKVVPASVEFVDIAGLVKGASQGAGLGNQFLGHIRNVDAVAMVLRAFEDPDIPTAGEDVDPLADLETLEVELTLADLGTLDRRIEKVHGQAKGHPRDFVEQLAWLSALRDHLNRGQPASAFDESPAHAEWTADLSLLTSKPRLFVINVAEADLPDGGPRAAPIQERAARESSPAGWLSGARAASAGRPPEAPSVAAGGVGGSPCLALCAVCEAELVTWPPDEAAAYRGDMGLTEPGLDRLIHASYKLLNLITFFTITGGKETRAWTLRRGSSAYEAAGLIHSDIQRGFIRAEVAPQAAIVAAGGLSGARTAGQLRLEGREYVVQDGDVIHFRFSV